MSYLGEHRNVNRKSRDMKTVALFALATLWLLAEAARHLPLLPGDWRGGAAMVEAAPGFLAPLMLLLVGWILVDLLTVSAATAAPSDHTAPTADGPDSGFDEAADAIESAAQKAAQIQADMAEQARAMKAAATRLDRAGVAALEGGTSIGTALANLEERLPPLLKSADEAEKALAEAAVSLEGQIVTFGDSLHAMREQSANVANEGMQAIERLRSTLAQLDEASGHTTQLVANRAYALDGAVTGVLERSVVVLDNIRESLLAQGRAIEVSVREARQELEACGQQSAAEIANRMDGLVERARALEAVLQANEERARTLTTEMDGWMARAESRLERLRADASAEMEGLKTGLLETQDDAETTIGRIAQAQTAATELQGLTATFAPTMDSFKSAVDAQLPEVGESLGRVGELSDHVRARVEQLAASVEACAGLLEALSKARAEEQGKFDALVARFMAANVR
ncbi:MAG: hypothetical protein ACK4MX_02775 [Thermaurantiacus sp.]